MHLYLFVAIALAGKASSKSFSEEISSISELSTLSDYLNRFPSIKSSFDSRSNATILAPDNDSLPNLIGDSTNSTEPLPNASSINAILNYHVIKGIHTSEDIDKGATFPHSELNDTGFANVTSGQVVQLVKRSGSNHVISGLNSDTDFERSDIKYDNGIIHIINEVLTLPQSTSATLLAANLTSFLGAIQNGSATSNANDRTDVTIFVPRNEGFRRVGSVFSNISSSDLENIANYHIVEGKTIHSVDMKDESLQTSANKDIHLSVINGVAFVNSARVVSTDLLVNNGVLHVISDVLNPNNETAEPVPDAYPPPVAFEGASSVESDPLTGGIPTPTSVIPLPAAASITGGSDGGGGGGGGGTATTSGPSSTSETSTTETSTSETSTGPSTPTTTASPAGAAPTNPMQNQLAAIVGLGALLINV
ncbi:hypothetical protein FQN57_002882 [Myotisia sp. PD_48]|nr:hypothetical protein FQN57_002882 [Myotisia sp. PD_48]